MKILIIANIDGFANSSKPTNIYERYKQKHRVLILDTKRITANLKVTDSKNRIKSLKVNKILFILQLIINLYRDYIYINKISNKLLFYITLLIEMKIRSQIVNKFIFTVGPDLVILENQLDSFIILKKQKYKILYDCPTPFADELYYGNQISLKHYQNFLNFEKTVYNNADFLSFHWKAYNDYEKKYIKSGKKTIVFNGGTNKKLTTAKFSNPIRVVYLGYIGGYWVNLPLLAHLTKLYPYIDIYGYPKPDSKYNLNYKGYADTNVLNKYQLGIVTISKDRLRSEGFSAKHIEYMSFGLPVLSPDWRISDVNIKGTIKYNSTNFLTIINKMNESKWKTYSESALLTSKKYEWNNVLKSLDLIINKVENEL